MTAVAKKAAKKAKKTKRKVTKSAGKIQKRASEAIARLEKQLPKRLAEYVSQAQRRIDRLERDVEKAAGRTRKEAVRLIREASHYLGKIEARGEKSWGKLTAPYRKDAVKLLQRLEKAIEVKKPKARKRKKAVAKSEPSAATTLPPAQGPTA